MNGKTGRQSQPVALRDGTLLLSQVRECFCQQLIFSKAKAASMMRNLVSAKGSQGARGGLALATHRFLDQHTRCSVSSDAYCTTASRRSSDESSFEHSNHSMLTTENPCSSLTLPKTFQRGDLESSAPDAGAEPSGGSSRGIRDKSSTHKPRAAATAMERPYSFPTAAMRHGPFEATYAASTRDSSHCSDTS